MLSIWKYGIPFQDNPIIEMPSRAQVLCVQSQNSIPNIWALVDPSMPLVSHKFRVAGTGHDIAETDARAYVGTFQVGDGALVFHVFDCGEV